MDRYNNREWLLLRVGCSSMTGVGMTEMMVGSRTLMLTAIAGMAAAAPPLGAS